jgi:hypothetical protein
VFPSTLILAEGEEVQRWHGGHSSPRRSDREARSSTVDVSAARASPWKGKLGANKPAGTSLKKRRLVQTETVVGEWLSRGKTSPLDASRSSRPSTEILPSDQMVFLYLIQPNTAELKRQQ